jgi:hypothetical protein
MDIPRWTPSQTVSRQEQYLLSRLKRTRKLFAFLRLHRDELFDDSFQAELSTMYRPSGAGKAPCPPALLAMVCLLQGYLGVSDAEAVELTVVDKRWQMVLDRLGHDEPAFAQGTLYDFRCRLIRTQMDRRLLERTVELARRTGGFDPSKLSKGLRLAVDSAPFEGAGRVEDTINLLWHAAGKLVTALVPLLGRDREQLCQEAGIPLLLASSAKRGLDVDWSDAEAKQQALEHLLDELESLVAWLSVCADEALTAKEVAEPLAVLGQVVSQDLEVAERGEGLQIRKGVAPDRRISVEDGEMRHGRKSASRGINGYKRHIATDLDTGLIVACAVTPANRPEQEATPELEKDLKAQGLRVVELHVDLAYANSTMAKSTMEAGGQVICRPRGNSRGEMFSKQDFAVDLQTMTITCPAGQRQPIELGKTVKFDGPVCGSCPMRERCTEAKSGQGRTVSIPADEEMQQERRRQVQTPQGRSRLRERVEVEHRLAHVVARQGDQAKYRGVRKNLYDLRRTAAIGNLERMQRTTRREVPIRPRREVESAGLSLAAA